MIIFRNSIFFCLIFLLLFVEMSSAAVTLNSNQIEGIQQRYFKEGNKQGVREIVAGGKKHYFVFSLSYNPFNDSSERLQKKLTLLSKGALFRYLKKRHKNLCGITVSSFTAGLLWKQDDKVYLLSYVDKRNVTMSLAHTKQGVVEATGNSTQRKEPIKTKEVQKQVSQQSSDGVIDREIRAIKSLLLKNPKAIEAYKQLYDYYRIKGDIDKASETADKIIKLKFEN